jgi:hypothetical protein
MTPLERAYKAFYSVEHLAGVDVRNMFDKKFRAALLSIATPEAIPDAAVEAFDREMWQFIGDFRNTFERKRAAIAAALRVIADNKADTTSPICPPNTGEPVTKS